MFCFVQESENNTAIRPNLPTKKTDNCFLTASKIQEVANCASRFKDEDIQTFRNFMTLVMDMDYEILRTAIRGGTYIRRGINASCYNNFEVVEKDTGIIALFTNFVKYYKNRGFTVDVDSEVDNGDTIYYVTISWEDKENK